MESKFFRFMYWIKTKKEKVFIPPMSFYFLNDMVIYYIWWNRVPYTRVNAVYQPRPSSTKYNECRFPIKQCRINTLSYRHDNKQTLRTDRRIVSKNCVCRTCLNTLIKLRSSVVYFSRKRHESSFPYWKIVSSLYSKAL